MIKKNIYTVTAALPYANGPIHIGHIAGAYLPADIYVRYLRMHKDNKVLFISGSDEHGAAITIQSNIEKSNPNDLINKYHNLNKKSFQSIGISFDIYYRTSSPLHHDFAKKIFIKLFNNNNLIAKDSYQYYDIQYNQFLADRYIIGKCPNCDNIKAYGDQCEQCGTTFSSTDLINPNSILSNTKPSIRKTKNLYLNLELWQEWLEKWINSKKDFWKKNIYTQCKGWLDIGLKARSVTRDLNWGIEVPIKNYTNKKLYVWLDAPIGYISATIQWGIYNNENWEIFWKSKNAKLIQFIGKDNIFFHTIIFPIILKSCDDNYILPYNIPSNEFMTLEGKKISKSNNHAVWIHQYVKDIPNGEDMLRYVITSLLPENKDSEFTWEKFQKHVNNELIAIYGNYINRVIVFINNNFNNCIPKISKINSLDKEIFNKIISFKNKIAFLIEKFYFRDALKEMMKIAKLGNKYLNETEPWNLLKTDYNRACTILNISINLVVNLIIISRPFLPFTSLKIFKVLNLNPIDDWDEIGKMDFLKKGDIINKSFILFEKITNKKVLFQVEKLYAK
ncbi:MAG: methionine--tRNA ligase [Bacteroides sp.]|nr:MAG: methionine--tRNA ligase [Bacteroides sp.]